MKTPRLLAFGFALASTFALNVAAGDFKRITIDGSFHDWAGIQPVLADPSDTTTSIDYAAVYVANDDDFLFLRVALHAPGDPFTARENIFIDADNDLATGFSVSGIGSEMLIQSGIGYEERAGTFNDGFNFNELGWAAAPSVTTTNFEFRISRHAAYTSSPPGPVFMGDTIVFVLEAETPSFASVEFAPDSGGQTYTFASAPSPATGNSTTVTVTSSSWQVNASGSDLGTAWREIGYDDTQAGWSSGAGLFGYTTNASVYPATIQTPVSAGRAVYYLRAHFQFTNDPASVILVASNYVSDGAVFYLNGAEVKRVRLPSGDVLFNTAATGGPSVKGQAELAGFATAPLVIGENVLAVEVHQTGGDTADLVFGMSLTAARQFPVVITDPSQPADRSVGAGDPTTFSAEFIGTPPLSFQWLKGGNPITDATNATLAFDAVLQGDAGSYSLRISNPLATNVTRSALLTVTNSPVRITDVTQPADRTVTEGLPASFTVPAVGSAPLSYQWFKAANNTTNAVLDATNETFTIPDARMSDAGDYFAVVTNPFPSSVTSRTARLTVTADTNPPTVLSVVATPNKITVTFSEPVTSASATTLANYSLTGGLTIASAAQDPGDASVVVVTTSAQTLGSSYTLTINNVFDRFNNVIAANTRVTFKSSIVIDGSFDDWASVPLAFSDPQDSTDSLDYKDAYVTNDDDYIYLRVTLWAPGDLADFHNNLFIDADNDVATGYSFSGIGSDLLIQSGGGYEQRPGVFNNGTASALDWLMAPEGASTAVEFRFSRRAIYDSNGASVFTTNMIAFALEAENAGFATREIAPDSGGHVYTFAGPAQLGPLTVGLNAQGQVAISWSGPGTLQSRPSLAGGTWQDISGAVNSYTTQPTNSQTYFRLIQ
ncbi:MAG TPA: hypothetical protein VJW76_11155 [Verrucomicrobiae bacterium]|nr:hypothetical protein [Verrucomicrobiae bacterium]